MHQPSSGGGWQLVKWQVPPEVAVERAGHSATVVGTTIVIAGGRQGYTFYNDVLRYDTQTSKITNPIAFPKGVRGRANHTATLVGSRIWFIGGGDNDDVCDEVFTLDVNTWTWQMVRVSDPAQLLRRTAHCAEVHPHLPSAILITGGFGVEKQGQPDNMLMDSLNDVVLFDTQSCSTEQLVPHKESVPAVRRGHHSMSILGDRLYVFGGRRIVAPGSKDTLLIEDAGALLGVFDIAASRWVAPEVVSGAQPTPRSSHRSVTLPDRVLIYGGAATTGSAAPTQRMTDVHSLVVLPSGQLMWSSCDSPAPGGAMPQGRNAHSLSLIGDSLFVVFGYYGTPSRKNSKYAMDAWICKVLPDAAVRHHPALAAARGAGTNRQAAAATAAAAAAGGQGQQSHKRHTAPGAAAAAAGTAGGSGGAAGCELGGSGGSAAAWRTVKRQRSGGKDKQQQQQQQPQAGCQQQQHTQGQQQQPAACPQQQQQQQHLPCDPSLTNYVAAAAAALGHMMVGGPGSRSPIHAGSPLRDSYAPPVCAAQQEVEALRDKLQESIRQSSSLGAEVRLLKQRLADAKTEARQEKQQSDRRLQEQQMEAARQSTLLEQANVRQRRAVEDATVAQQDLAAAKQQLQKAEVERDAAAQQLQALHAEARKLRAQHKKADQEVRQLQLQVHQQQQQDRRLQEQLARERQQQQEEVAATRASIEQHRIELRRLNDTMADQKQKYDRSLQETTQQLHDVQRQLQEALTAAADARKQRQDALQLHASTREQLDALSTTHKAALVEKGRVEAELAKLQDEQRQAKRELEQRRLAGLSMQAALQQVQNAMQAAVNVSGQLLGPQS